MGYSSSNIIWQLIRQQYNLKTNDDKKVKHAIEIYPWLSNDDFEFDLDNN